MIDIRGAISHMHLTQPFFYNEEHMREEFRSALLRFSEGYDITPGMRIPFHSSQMEEYRKRHSRLFIRQYADGWIRRKTYTPIEDRHHDGYYEPASVGGYHGAYETKYRIHNHGTLEYNGMYADIPDQTSGIGNTLYDIFWDLMRLEFLVGLFH